MDLSSLWAQSAGFGATAGVFLPPVAAVVLRPHWMAATKQHIVMCLSVLSGLVTVAAAGAFAEGPVLSAATVAAVYAASQVTYKVLWHRYGITQTIETRTSPTAGCPVGCPIESGLCLRCERWLGVARSTKEVSAPRVQADGPAEGEDPPSSRV